ncbi:hypothetical protein DF046_36435 [Burkholderia cepacia]|nr:hypothetical protein WJ06_04500 [Burkholderia cepacia]KWC89634.1 hypothetical protein WL58_04730 [Burkholderia cepacia]RQT43230.1 hypothetical protein DF046_36435 [Burkholderia cepacia]
MAAEAQPWLGSSETELFRPERHENIAQLTNASHWACVVVRSNNGLYCLCADTPLTTQPAQPIRYINEMLTIAPQLSQRTKFSIAFDSTIVLEKENAVLQS